MWSGWMRLQIEPKPGSRFGPSRNPRSYESSDMKSKFDSPCADSNIGHSAGLLARLFLIQLIRKHTVGDSLVRRHATYREPLACERNESAMIHGRFAIKRDDLPVLLVDIE